MLAARAGADFVTVDSDRRFLEAVRARVAELSPDHRGSFLFADIGRTGRWGIPLAPWSRPDRWARYAALPWETIMAEKRPLPDFVLVDGRFRVACALTSIKHLQPSGDFEIAVDDYLARTSYRTIERFARLDRMIGRLAIFRPARPEPDELDRAIAAASSEWL